MTDRGQIRWEKSNKRVRVYLGGEVVADSRKPLLVWEKPYFPTYFFPREDVRTDQLVESDETSQSPNMGEATVYTVKGGDTEAPAAAYSYLDGPAEEWGAYVAFNWRKMDHWFEEDEEVYVHPRDPNTRVDILRSSRHVEIMIDGLKVADSHSPVLLLETGLPVRYYLPKTDVRMELLKKTESHTECPYKGVAEYWSVSINGSEYPDYVWSYPFPTLESAKIAGLMCFYNEKVDIIVDGKLEERPQSPFS
jgi:uncharacterized protein (DUF427 family)